MLSVLKPENKIINNFDNKNWNSFINILKTYLRILYYTILFTIIFKRKKSIEKSLG